jgi:predicted alpha/beta hydrolase
VVLAHALGLSADAFRYGGGPTLARHLSRRGFAVYLLTHRGDRAALPPDPGRARHFDFDDIVRSDLPAAVERACAHAGFPRVHWVGHGLGGQLGLALAGRSPDRLATLTALCAPAAFPRSAVRSEARRWARAAALLPEHWHLPTRAVAWAAVPWVSEGDGQLVAASPGPRVRGVLSHAVEDLPLGLMGQVQRWMAEGAFTDRTGALDYTEALCEARAPLLVVHAADDPLCPPAAALAAVHRWAHPDRTSLALPEGWGHLDPLLARDAPEAVFRPVGDWLVARRTAAWERDPEVLRRAR